MTKNGVDIMNTNTNLSSKVNNNKTHKVSFNLHEKLALQSDIFYDEVFTAVSRF